MTQAIFSRDSKFLFILDSDFQAQELLVWDVQAGRVRNRFAGKKTGIIIERGNRSRFPSAVQAIFPVGDVLLAVLRGGAIQVWDWQKGERREDVPLSPVEENGLHLSPDGKTLLLRARDGTWQLWDTGTWKPRKVLASGTSGRSTVLPSADGKTLTFVDARAVRRWDLEKMRESSVFPLRTGTSPAYSRSSHFWGRAARA